MSTATNFSDSFPFSLSQMNAEIRDIGASTSTDNPPIFDCHQRSDFAVGGDKIQELYTFQQRASDNMSWSFAKEDDSTGDLTRESVEECPLSLIQDSQKEAAANKYQQSDGFGIEKEDDDDDNKPCEEHRVDLDCEVKIKISDKSRLSAIEVAGFNLSFVALFIGLAFAVLIGIPSFFGQEMLLATKKVFVLKDLVSGLPLCFLRDVDGYYSFLSMYRNSYSGLVLHPSRKFNGSCLHHSNNSNNHPLRSFGKFYYAKIHGQNWPFLSTEFSFHVVTCSKHHYLRGSRTSCLATFSIAFSKVAEDENGIFRCSKGS
ncbi:hypothetical protein Dsin_015115 [Dipteronia sinensis]|uniref:Transmembrane protein n=1 Tax=Dipteronia sinensis TaxID=43782 RepID=A0AAE0AP58_9ROSI|nr:hypothetical protein Dsin_015115 [Dipteronia sinensis]